MRKKTRSALVIVLDRLRTWPAITLVAAGTVCVAVSVLKYYNPGASVAHVGDHKASQELQSVMSKPADHEQRLRHIAEALDPDLAKAVPMIFEPAFKNPCWKDADGEITCLPYFYVLGGFQSGAYNLYSRLSQHPDVAKAHNPRTHFWGEAGKASELYFHEMKPSFQAVKQQPVATIIGDASESTLAFYWSAGIRAHRAFEATIVPCWQNCSKDATDEQRNNCMEEICYPAAKAADQKVAAELGLLYIDMALPVVMRGVYNGGLPRLLALVRDPVERLHSAFWAYGHYQSKYGATAEGFDAFVKEQLGAFHSCVKAGHTVDECTLLFESLGTEQEKVFFHCDQVLRGLYAVYLERWLSLFPSERILVLRSEDYFADSAKQLAKVAAWLGLRPLDEADWMDAGKAAPRPTSSRDGKPSMSLETKQLLQAFYGPFNERLAKLLKDDKFLYKTS